jgi:tetratricopeptide (TPR) repeat protein
MDESQIAEPEDIEVTPGNDRELERAIIDQKYADKEQLLIVLKEQRQAFTKDPRNVQLLLELGETAEAVGDIDRARWAYKRALHLDSGYAGAYRNLGILYEKEGRTKQAAEALQNYLSYAGDGADTEVVMNSLKNLTGSDDEDGSQPAESAPHASELNKKREELGLTPGEAMFLLDPENSSGREMMRYTLLDMIMRGIFERDGQNGVGRGEQYGETELSPHERLFAKYFARYDDVIDLDRLARAAATELDNRFDVYKTNYIREPLEKKGYIQKETQRVGGVLPVQRYVLTDKGNKASNELRRLLKDVKRQLDHTVKSNPQQASAYISDGGPPILLIESYPASYFQEWLDTLDRIGLGPAVKRVRSRFQGSTAADLADEILKIILGN